MLAAECLDTADAGTDGTSETGGIDMVAHLKTAVLHGLCGGSKGIKGIDVVVANHSLVD